MLGNPSNEDLGLLSERTVQSTYLTLIKGTIAEKTVEDKRKIFRTLRETTGVTPSPKVVEAQQEL